MDHPRCFYLVVLSIVGAAGLALKIITMGPTAAVGQPNVAGHEIDQRLASHGFSLIGVRRVTTDGNFRMRLYDAPYCPRPVMLLPLKRNAEGARILRARLIGEWRQPRFVLAGKTYPDFPTLRLWWQQLASATRVWDRNRRPPVVWAVAESTLCAGTQPFHELLS